MPLGATKVGLLGAAGSAGGAAMTAFGGIITQYVDSGTTYRVHTFRGSGKFFVSAGAADVDWLLVAGGGGTGVAGGGAGGSSVATAAFYCPFTFLYFGQIKSTRPSVPNFRIPAREARRGNFRVFLR